MSLFLPHPFFKIFAPKEDGLLVVKRQGRVIYVALANKKKTGKDLKQTVKALFRTGNDVHEHFYDMKQIMSVKFIKQANYEEALKEQQRLIQKYKTDTKYNK